MKLLLTGLSHKTASVQLREKLALPEAALPDALHELQNFGASEAMILSTCNRVEIALTSPDGQEPAAIVERFLKAWQGSANAFEGHLYRLEARAAIQHLFRVASSLDSMVVGEPQILGQLKSAYAMAKSEGAVGGLLEQVLTRAFGVAKRVRTETGIGQMAVSVSYAAVELARKIFGFAEGPRGSDHRIRQDGRAGRQAPAPVRGERVFSSPTGRGNGRRKWRRLFRGAPSITANFPRCCTRWIS